MIETSIRVGTCKNIQKHSKVNNKYMKDHDPSTESSYLLF